MAARPFPPAALVAAMALVLWAPVREPLGASAADTQLPSGTALPSRDPVGRPSAAVDVITGRVLGADDGRPLARALIRARMVRSLEPGVSDAAPDHLTLTDAQGRFELPPLAAPAHYLVSASKAGYLTLAHGQRMVTGTGTPVELAAGATVGPVSIVLPRSSAIAGRVFDTFGDAVTGARVQALRYEYAGGQLAVADQPAHASSTDDRGEFRLFGLPPGDYLVSAAPDAATPEVDGLLHLPTYYPGSLSPQAARLVTLGVGHEATDIAISLVRSRHVSISGRVVDARGRPAERAILRLRQALPSGGSLRSRDIGLTRADGSFSVANLVPGQYTIEGRSADWTEHRALEVQIHDADITDLPLALAPLAAVRGRLTGPDGRPPAGLRPSDVLVHATPFPSEQLPLRSTGQGRVDSDWTFEIGELAGTRVLDIQVPADWMLRRVTYGGRDVTDTVLDLHHGGVDGIVVELTQAVSEVTGRAIDASGTPARSFVALVFADTPERWTSPTRFVRTARPDDAGSFRIRGLPPGRYLAIALHDLRPGDELNPLLLNRLRRSGAATGLTVAEGDTHAITVRSWSDF